ncbi:MAG: cadherin-like beta sandwich domain-containing protein [Aquisalimonadaceae bacterium]
MIFLTVLLTGCSGGSGVGDETNPHSPASLSALTLSSGNLDQIFQPVLTTYTTTQGFLSQSLRVIPTAVDPAATITVNGEPVDSGQASQAIPLEEGAETVITIAVTEAGGATTVTYTLDATRQLAASFAQQAYAKASNTGANDQFGHSVALSGDTLAVGAPSEGSDDTGIDGDQHNDDASGSGAVYVFTRDAGGTWSQQAYIKASNAEAGDQFGYSLALSGDTLAVGANFEASNASGINDDESNNDLLASGAAYVFTRDGAGTWSQQAYVKASNPGAFDAFGYSVALSGDTLAVGAFGEDSIATGIGGDESNNDALESGAAYVFTRDTAGIWSQQAYVKASNTGDDDVFGWSIALSGDTLAVGARQEGSDATGVDDTQSNNDANNSGAVYMFTRDALGDWSQQAYVKASNTEASDFFGSSVTVSGDTLAVGAPSEDSDAIGVNGDESNNDKEDSGAVYMFTRNELDNWSQQAYVKASNTETLDSSFGQSVALSGDTLVVGAHLEKSDSIGINGDQTGTGPSSYGAAYAFTRDEGGIWTQQAYLKASNTGASDQFGWSVALFGDTVAVGAVAEDSDATGMDDDQDNDDASGSGAVYVFK